MAGLLPLHMARSDIDWKERCGVPWAAKRETSTYVAILTLFRRVVNTPFRYAVPTEPKSWSFAATTASIAVSARCITSSTSGFPGAWNVARSAAI